MICYRDMTFCAADCATTDCSRKLTDEVRAAAERWWPGMAPVAQADFSNTCEHYKTPSEQEASDE